MTAQPDDFDPDLDITLHYTFMDSDGPEITLHTKHIGLSPAIYIEPELDDESGSIQINILAVDIDQDGLAGMLETIARAVRSGEVVYDEEDDGEEHGI